MNSLIQVGLLPRTCVVEILGQSKKYYCNYWDVLQTSASFSLHAIGTHPKFASEFAESLCDEIAGWYEDGRYSDDLSFDDLVPIVDLEIGGYLQYSGPDLKKYERDVVVVKVAIDLINSSLRLAQGLS